MMPVDIDIDLLRRFVAVAKIGTVGSCGIAGTFRKIATESLEKASRKWEIMFTGTAITSTQAAVQAGVGQPILKKGAPKAGIKRRLRR